MEAVLSSFCVHRSPFSVRKAFTLIELIIGIAIMTIILAAMAVFSYGVGQGWTQSESAQSVFLAGNLAGHRIERVIRAAKMIDSNATHGSLDDPAAPPAACMFWRNDDNGDGKIQFSEMALLAYDPASQTVLEYTAQPGSKDWTAEPPSFVSPTTFMNTPGVTATPLAHNVTGCQFFPIAPGGNTQRPSLEYVLRVGDGQAQTVQYGTATLRSPNSEPN